MSKVKTSWCVVIVAPRRELEVARRLKRMEIETIVPTERPAAKKWRSALNRRKPREAVRRPMMPRYVFADLSDADFFPVSCAPFVHGFMAVDGAIRRLTEKEMDLIREMETRPAARREADRTFKSFAAGQIVKVTEGPATGLKFRVVADSEGERVRAEEEGSGREIDLPAGILESAA